MLFRSIDAIIKLIRESEDAGAAKTALMAKPYEFTEVQAIDILDMQLRQLTRLSRIDLEAEIAQLNEKIAEFQAILADDKKLRGVITDELTEIKNEFATPRVCPITFEAGEMSLEDLVDDTELVVIMTEAQYVKSVAASNFRNQQRGGKGVSGAKLKSEDVVKHVIFTTAHAYLLFFSNRGRVYRLRAHDLPEREQIGRAHV